MCKARLRPSLVWYNSKASFEHFGSPLALVCLKYRYILSYMDQNMKLLDMTLLKFMVISPNIKLQSKVFQ